MDHSTVPNLLTPRGINTWTRAGSLNGLGDTDGTADLPLWLAGLGFAAAVLSQHLCRETLVIYCQTTSHAATHYATCRTPCLPRTQAFSGWIRTPLPTLSSFSRPVQWFRSAFEFQAHTLSYYST